MADELGRPWHCYVAHDIWRVINARGETVAHVFLEDEAVAIVSAVNAAPYVAALVQASRRIVRDVEQDTLEDDIAIERLDAALRPFEGGETGKT